MINKPLAALLLVSVFSVGVLGSREYMITTFTRYDDYSGTDGRVSITLFGAKGDSQELELINSETFSDPFETGHKDKFRFNLDDLGTIYKIKLRHERGGNYPKWRLGKVIVASQHFPQDTSTFNCQATLNGNSKEFFKWCEAGYKATQDSGWMCEDVNECETIRCADLKATCTNLDGSFMCECPAGYQMPPGQLNDYCKDIKECNNNNGGCNQICDEKEGSFECKCDDGYVLGDDNKTCSDVNECERNPNLCPALSTCHNKPGGFECKCDPGYKKDGVLCTDVDECAPDYINDCNKLISTCENYQGGYKCNCKSGYENTTPKTCQDKNECDTGENVCVTDMSKCVNTEGDYMCQCKTGYHQGSDDKTCIPDKCGPLVSPTGGVITPQKCVGADPLVYQTTCQVSCINGYEPVNPDEMAITCLTLGRWSGTIPLCKPVSCPALTAPANGELWPAKCASTGTVFNSRCTYICNNGYKLVGNTARLCQADQTYSGSTPKCEKVVAKPWVQCPGSISEVLPLGKGEVDISSKWKMPTSNMDQSHLTYKISPAPASGFVLKYGQSTVTWTATNENGEQATCSYVITIVDVEKPKVTNCPTESIKILITTKSTRVTWPALVFTDNVGTRTPVGTHTNGQEFSLGTHNVEIYAEDPAGNRATCDFQVVVDKKGCPELKGPVNGQASCQPFNMDQFCTIFCPSGKTLFAGMSMYGSYWTCSAGTWAPLDYVPDCVDYSTYVESQSCPDGKVVIDSFLNYQAVKLCASCPTGTYYYEGRCVECDAGTYQDVEGQTSCKACPVGKSSYPGAKNATTDCLDQCNKGEFSRNGFQPCLHCDKNSYQDEIGQTQCKSCPDGMETGVVGATSKDKCGAAPQIVSITPQSVTKTEGESVVFECRVSGTPYPIVVWKNLQKERIPDDFLGKDTQEVIMSNGERVGMRLKITGLTEHNTGSYECQLTNRHGTASAKATLKVELDLSSGSGAV